MLFQFLLDNALPVALIFAGGIFLTMSLFLYAVERGTQRQLRDATDVLRQSPSAGNSESRGQRATLDEHAQAIAILQGDVDALRGKTELTGTEVQAVTERNEDTLNRLGHLERLIQELETAKTTLLRIETEEWFEGFLDNSGKEARSGAQIERAILERIKEHKGASEVFLKKLGSHLAILEYNLRPDAQYSFSLCIATRCLGDTSLARPFGRGFNQMVLHRELFDPAEDWVTVCEQGLVAIRAFLKDEAIQSEDETVRVLLDCLGKAVEHAALQPSGISVYVTHKVDCPETDLKYLFQGIATYIKKEPELSEEDLARLYEPIQTALTERCDAIEIALEYMEIADKMELNERSRAVLDEWATGNLLGPIRAGCDRLLDRITSLTSHLRQSGLTMPHRVEGEPPTPGPISPDSFGDEFFGAHP